MRKLILALCLMAFAAGGQPPQITPEQALRNLDLAVSQLELKRQDHIILIESLATLRRVVEEHAACAVEAPEAAE